MNDYIPNVISGTTKCTANIKNLKFISTLVKNTSVGKMFGNSKTDLHIVDCNLVVDHSKIERCVVNVIGMNF